MSQFQHVDITSGPGSCMCGLCQCKAEVARLEREKAALEFQLNGLCAILQKLVDRGDGLKRHEGLFVFDLVTEAREALKPHD